MTVKRSRKLKKNKSTLKEITYIRYRSPQFHHYRGRFAPSPTGPLHYGSLVTAVASYLQARTQHGEWLIRIEDIDPEREPKDAAQSILQTLEDFGFYWDRKPIFQSQHHNLHSYFAEQFYAHKLAYRCICSRKDLAHSSNIGAMGSIYPGTCSNKSHSSDHYTLRVRTKNIIVNYIDQKYGPQTCNLEKESGDFVIYRADKRPSYILAASVDDIFEGYSEIVRGSDLLAITPRQIHLTQLLQKKQPKFFHIPIIVDDGGNKLSKQTHATALKSYLARDEISHALKDLGQEPPKHLLWRPLWASWDWAIAHWNPQAIPPEKYIRFNH